MKEEMERKIEWIKKNCLRKWKIYKGVEKMKSKGLSEERAIVEVAKAINKKKEDVATEYEYVRCMLLSRIFSDLIR